MLEGGTTCVVVVPVLRRPHRVVPLIESLRAATPEPHRLLFMCTAGDDAEIEAVDRAGAERLVISPNGDGDYAIKVNTALKETAEPFLFTGADDLHFHPGWLSAALVEMTDPAVGVVGTNDLGNPRVQEGRHSTHSLVRRTYVEQHGLIDEPGKVFFEGYPHEYVDDELVQTAKVRGAWAFAWGSIVEHLHPNWGKAPTDELYDAQWDRMARGRAMFKRRRHLWLHPSPS
jgi:hypothetical protein